MLYKDRIDSRPVLSQRQLRLEERQVKLMNPSQAFLRGDLIPTPRPRPTNPTSSGQSVRHVTVLVSGPRFWHENRWSYLHQETSLEPKLASGNFV